MLYFEIEKANKKLEHLKFENSDEEIKNYVEKIDDDKDL